LPTPAEIDERLRFTVDFVNRAEFWVESKKILTMRLISDRLGDELIQETSLRENRLRANEDR